MLVARTPLPRVFVERHRRVHARVHRLPQDDRAAGGPRIEEVDAAAAGRQLAQARQGSVELPTKLGELLRPPEPQDAGLADAYLDLTAPPGTTAAVSSAAMRALRETRMMASGAPGTGASGRPETEMLGSILSSPQVHDRRSRWNW